MTTCRFCDRSVPPASQQCPHCGAPVLGTVPHSDQDLQQQIQTLLDQGQKLAAVKLYKHQTGASLKEAKEAVEAIESGDRPEQTARHEPDTEEQAELLQLLEAGKKIEAIKRYRQRTGVSLIEAKQAIEALGTRRGLTAQGSGCASVLLVLLVAVIVIVLSHCAVL